MYETKQLIQEFCSISTMLLDLDIASVEQLSSLVDITSYQSLRSRRRPGIDVWPLLRCRGGLDLQISLISFLSLITFLYFLNLCMFCLPFARFL